MGQNASRTSSHRPEADIGNLVQMGFEPGAAREALLASGGDVARAAEFLLGNAEAHARTRVPTRPSQAEARRESALLAAQSRAVATRTGMSRSPLPFARASAPAARSRSREETILRSASALATMPESLDLLCTSLGKVLSNPNEPKFKRVPLRNPNFAKHVMDAPGGLELLSAIGYERDADALVLRAHDETMLTLALSALEAARGSELYRDAKSEQLLVLALTESQTEWDQAERDRRADAATRVPAEPADGAAGNTLLCFHLGTKRDRSRCVWRRFESCNTLKDVCAYVEATTPFVLGRTAEIYDITLAATPEKLDGAKLTLTLQNLGMWPSAHIQVRPIVGAA